MKTINASFRWLTAVVFAATSVVAQGDEKLDLSKPEDAFIVWAKSMCSLDESDHVLHWWRGKMFSRVPGEKDRHLFNVQGMNIRNCKFYPEGDRAPGIRSTSREVMLYLDPVTNEVVETWQNPFTGETVDVVQVANDPVNMRDIFWAKDEAGNYAGIGMDQMLMGNRILSGGGAARLFYDNPLAGDYQQYVGGTYHAMEYGTDSINATEALDPTTKTVHDVNISWGRISKWLPWMKMGDRDGVVVFHTAGMRLTSFDQLPDVLRNEIDKNYPIYREPPPTDDARPNETSWTVFKKYLEEKGHSAEKSSH